MLSVFYLLFNQLIYPCIKIQARTATTQGFDPSASLLLRVYSCLLSNQITELGLLIRPNMFRLFNKNTVCLCLCASTMGAILILLLPYYYMTKVHYLLNVC